MLTNPETMWTEGKAIASLLNAFEKACNKYLSPRLHLRI